MLDKSHIASKYVQSYAQGLAESPYDFEITDNAQKRCQLNNNQTVTKADIQGMSYEDALFRLGKYVANDSVRTVLFDYHTQNGKNDPKKHRATVTALHSYLEDFFVHENFKLAKSKIPAIHPAVVTDGSVGFLDKNEEKTRARVITQADSTGTLREFVDVPWATEGLALAPFHSLFYRTDKMRASNGNDQTIVPAFYDTIIEEIQDVTLRLLGGSFDTNGKKTTYESELQACIKNEDLSSEIQAKLEYYIDLFINKIRATKGLYVESPEFNTFFDSSNPHSFPALLRSNKTLAATSIDSSFILKRLKDLAFLWFLRSSLENLFEGESNSKPMKALDLSSTDQDTRRQGLPKINQEFNPKYLKTEASLCPHATITCKHSCLVTSGNNTLAGTNLLGRFFNPTGSSRPDTEAVPNRDLSPYQTYNLAKKMISSIMIYKEPVAFCRVLVEALLKHSIKKEKYRDFLAKGEASSYYKDFSELSDFDKALKYNMNSLKPEAAEKGNLPVFFRLNVYSDIVWEKFFPFLFELFDGEHTTADLDTARIDDVKIPLIQFYDYTKVPNRGPFKYDDHGRVLGTDGNPISEDQKKGITYSNHKALVPSLSNYHLTFSFGGTNSQDCIRELYFNKKNITVAFYKPNNGYIEKQTKGLIKLATKAVENSSKPEAFQSTLDIASFFSQFKGSTPFPKTFLGYDVIDGDLYDNRTFDLLFQKDGVPVVIGLKWKEIRVGIDYKVSTPLNDAMASLFSFVRLPDISLGSKTWHSINVNLAKDTQKMTLVLNSRKDLLEQLKADPELLKMFEFELGRIDALDLPTSELSEMDRNLYAYYKCLLENKAFQARYGSWSDRTILKA